VTFFRRLLGVFKQIPLLVAGAQQLFGAGTGPIKADFVSSQVADLIGVIEAVANKDIMDEKAFMEGIDMVREGVVRCLKASVMYQKPQTQ